MRGDLNKISAYLTDHEMEEFMRHVRMRGAGQSGLIREMLGFAVRPRGAPKGPRKKKQTDKSQSAAKASKASKGQEKKSAQGKTQLSLLD